MIWGPQLDAGRRRHQSGKLLRQIWRLDRVIFHDLAIGQTVVGQASAIDLLPSGRRLCSDLSTRSCDPFPGAAAPCRRGRTRHWPCATVDATVWGRRAGGDPKAPVPPSRAPSTVAPIWGRLTPRCDGRRAIPGMAETRAAQQEWTDPWYPGGERILGALERVGLPAKALRASPRSRDDRRAHCVPCQIRQGR